MENLKKTKHLPEILTIIGVLVVGYYAVVSTSIPSPKSAQNAIVDFKTGLSVPQEKINAIAQKQEQEMTTHTLTGKVTAKLRDSLQVEAVTSGKTRNLQVKFAPNTIFLKDMPPLSSVPVEEKEISFADVNVGDMIIMAFPQGILLSKMNEMGVITADNLTVNAPHQPGFAKD